MSPELSSCLAQLKLCLGMQQASKARTLISRITQLIVDKTGDSEAQTEYDLECIFDTSDGLIAFLRGSFSHAKQLAKANEDVFELFRKTIQKHSTLLHKRMASMVSVILRYIQCSSVTARERELAALVLQDGIAYGCLRKDSYERLDQLCDELLKVFQQRKLPNRFQQNLFELLGQLAKTFPECVTEPDRLRDAFLNAAESQLLEENYPSLVSLAGAIRGMNLFLFHFAPSEEEVELRKRLYVLVKKLSIWEEGRSERAVSRNALQVLADHAPLFTVYLYRDHVHWQTLLVGNWLKSTNRDDHLIALVALYAFHGEMVRVLSRTDTATESEGECARTVDVLNQYLAYYRKLLNSASADRWEVRIAIRGFGIMAESCCRLASDGGTLNELLTTVLDRIEGICGQTSSTADDMLEYLPDFVQALSEILPHARELSTVQLTSVRTMIVALIRDFYHLSVVHHELIIRSLLSTLTNIGKLGGSALELLLDNVLLQGVIWSCTHSLPYAIGPPVMSLLTTRTIAGKTSHQYDWKRELVTYKNYLPLWQGLLGGRFQNVDGNPEDDGTLTRAIYRAFMRTLFVIVEKLDFSTRKRTFRDEDGGQSELFFCDPNLDLIPNKPKDYHIFLNLVELCRDVLHGPQTPTTVREMYAEWISRYFDQFVKQSFRHPLVSGFVKLIEMGLRTAESIGYFCAALDDFDSHSTAMLLKFYMESTIRKALQATGELQLACLRFVLNAPARLLVDFIEDQEQSEPLLVAVLQAAFRVGRGFISIARTGLSCLQRIVRFRDPPVHAEQREQLLRLVLPMLEPYLQTRDSALPPAASVRLAKYKRQRTANLAQGKIEQVKQQHRIEQAMETSELVAFQMRVLNFLGDLQPNECCWMVPVDDQDHSAVVDGFPSLVRWDAHSERSVELRLLCSTGTRPCIKLDSIIGRVCLLAVKASDRATKLAACELLHTIVLYLLGIHYQDQLHGLWSQLCSHLLQLSCDTDLAVCQMFEPLLFQIIHYLTRPSKLSQQGTNALIDCLMDATSNEQNSAIRDLSVRCLREFLQWTNRQSGGSASLNDRMKVKRTLLEQLKTYALESNASRRYGSAQAFNNLFRLLAQDDDHVVRYWFELTHAFAIGFIVTEEQLGAVELDGHGGGLEQFGLALEHAIKVLEQRRVLFTGKYDEPGLGELRQIIPPAIKGGELKHLASWLFRQCAARQKLYRRKCMQLFLRLARSVPDVTSGEQFIRKHFTPGQVEAICLQVGIRQGLAQAPTLDSLREPEPQSLITNIYLWLEYFLATLDITCWLLKEKLVPKECFKPLLARVLPVVRYFLQSLINVSMYGLMILVNPNIAVDTRVSSFQLRINADKVVRFDALKTALVIQTVDLLALVLELSDQTDNGQQLYQELWEDQSTIGFTMMLLFESQQLGVDSYHALETDRRLWKQLDTLVIQLTRRQSNFTEALTEKVITLMEELGVRIKTLLIQRTVNKIDQNIAKGLLFIAKLQQKQTGAHSMLLHSTSEGRFQNAARKLLDDCYEFIGQDGIRMLLTPSAARFGTIVLQVIFSLSIVGDHVERSLLQRTIECSLDCRQLQPNISHGQHFIGCFGAAVFDLFLTDSSGCVNSLLSALAADNFHAIVRLLCDVMDHLYQSRPSDKERRRNLTGIVLGGWDRFFECSRLQEGHLGAYDLQLIELMSNVAMVCPFPLNAIRLKAGAGYERWLVEQIASSTVPIGLKSKAIVLLPTLLGAEDNCAVTNGPIEDALESLQTKHFPLRSSEFPPNSPQRVGFVNCLERLLDALVVSRSPLLLKVIIQMTAPDGQGNVAERQIRVAIERFFADQSSAMQYERLQEVWELFANHSYAPTVRVTILKRYLCTGLWRCSYDTITSFYGQNINAISGLVNVELNGRTGWDLEHALVDLAAGFQLMEQYAALLPRSDLLMEYSAISAQLYGSVAEGSGASAHGQRLIADFSRRAHSVRKLPFRTDNSTVAELFRQYQCAAYRALVALISNTNDDARMYSVLLFRENREKGEFIWRQLINCGNDELYLESGQEVNETPRIMEKRVAIRREGDVAGSTPSEPPGYSVVAESSLSQQVSRFDFHHSVVLSAQEVALRDAAQLSGRQKGTQSSVPLERTKINEHEVMATVCGCIRHMAASSIATEAAVRFIVASLLDPGQPKNVRLFLAKVIDNCRKELTPHAALLLLPLMQLIVDEQIFRGLNTLVTDLIALVLEWSVQRPPRAASGGIDASAPLASALLRFLMKYSCRQTGGRAQQQVFRLNLELIRTLLGQWNDVLTVPAELLFAMITSWEASQMEERSQFELIAGMQLGSVVLINGGGRLVPWMDSNREDYLWAIVRCLDASNSSTYKPAAQLLGLSLARLYPNGVPEDRPEKEGGSGDDNDFLTGCISTLSNIHRVQKRKFVEILYETGKGFPSIVNPFLSIVSCRIPAGTPAEKRMSLELLLGGRVERFGDELYRELASLDLARLLCDGDLQLATLHLLNRSLPLVGELHDLQQLIDRIGTVATQRTTPPACRAVAYEILIYIHEKRATELSAEKRETLWRCLIRGLCDTEEADPATMTSIRARVLEYLSESGKLPGDVRERFLYVLAELYDPAAEAEFLGCAVWLLLDPAIRCRESKDRLFLHEYLRADVKFRQYTIETAARQRHSMAPLFAESSTQRQLQSFITGTGSQMELMIRATQFAGGQSTLVDEESQFEPTQDPAPISRARDTFALPTQHSLLFEASSLQLDRRSQRTGSVPAEADTEERTFERLRKRILNDSEASRQQQTAWAVGRHYSTHRKHTEQRRESGSKVALFRRYRLGDYPDLQINLLAFLLPLQALCRRDALCARQTFVAIFNGLVESLSAEPATGGTGDEWGRFLGRLDRSLQHILESTKSCDPNLFGGLIELSLGKALGKLTVSPQTVASVAGVSNMLTMGVLYIEGKLIGGDEFDAEPVRSGGSHSSSEADHWLQLSTLYHTLREHDAVAGIFGDHLDSDPQLRNAIELEALAQYDQAYRAYYELIASISPARDEERNFCYKSTFDCLLRLGEWEVLLNTITEQVANHDELWTDEWNKENMLPSYMHGNVRLNLAGDASGQEFCRVLNGWMDIPVRAEYIRQQFGEELTALQLACGELVRARFYAEQTQRHFLEEWQCAAGVLSELFRIECLLEVRKVIELRAFSELLDARELLATGTERLVVAWRNAYPKVTDSLITWDTIVVYRRFLLGQLEKKEPAGAHLSKLSEMLVELELRLLDVAFEQDNITYAGKMIARLRTDEANGGNRELRPEQFVRRRIARLRYDRARQLRDGTQADCSQLLKGFGRLHKLATQTVQLEASQRVPRASSAAWTELFHYSESFLAGITSAGMEECTAVLNIIRSTAGDDIANEGLSTGLRRFSLHCLQRSIDEVVGGRSKLFESAEEGERATSARELADAYLRMAQYCYERLNAARNEQAELSIERRLVTALLPAIQYGSPEARQLFPVLLPLRNLHNNALRHEFDELSRSVPTWNFLTWIPQLLSHFKVVSSHGSSVGSFLDELLLRIAKEYPMALYFHARITMGRAASPESPAVGRIRAALRQPVMDRFVEELCRVVMPELRLRTAMVTLKGKLDTFVRREEYQTFVQEALSDDFTLDANDRRYGKAYRAMAPYVEKWLALKELHPIDERDAIVERLGDIEASLKSLRSRALINRVQLEDFSPWLADYHYSGQHDAAIELPGQYGQDSRPPNTAGRVRLVKVVADLTVYDTLRLPVQITFRGSDGKHYRFLAKYGEDLRQDQRIQQLQRAITYRLRLDRRCTEQRLELRTYPVVPIRPDFGMLGWLEGTVSLQDIAKQAAPRYNPTTDRGQAYVREQYGRFLLAASQQAPVSDELPNPSALHSATTYAMAACHCTPERLRLKYLELAQTIRGDTLKRALFDMATSPESFYRLRMNFGRSLATMNITGWVLGIGDRHLSNVVLERATGKLVGVDFGMAFGAGTRDLPVPELVPFRLTPQFVGVMAPMGLSGVVHKCHLYTLQCLRDARKLLRACLEVFIREPTVDWLEAARQRSSAEEPRGADARTRHSSAWDPQTRVDNVMRKLHGVNPKQLLMEQLRLGVIAREREEFLAGYLSIVESAAEESTRKVAAYGRQTKLPTELQVDMLLEMATDAKLLGIAYAGWYPWF